MRYAGVLTAAFLKDAGGLFFPVCSGRVNGKLFISIGYADADGSMAVGQLIESVRRVLDEFDLIGIVE